MSKILGKGIYIMGEPPVVAGSLTVGSSVFTNVNGVKTEFIVVHQGKPSSLYDESCNGTWLLMKDIYENRVWQSGNINKYESSDIHSYLNNTFLKLFDSNIQGAIKQVKLPYRKNGGSGGTTQQGANGLPCKIFLLSAPEVHYEQTYIDSGEGAALSYFASCVTNGADSKRVAYLSGSAAHWWLRSPDTSNTSSVWNVGTSGGYYSNGASNSRGIRPALVLPSTALIDSKGNITGKAQSLTGTWVFNSTISYPVGTVTWPDWNGEFTSNGTTYYGTFEGSNNDLVYKIVAGGAGGQSVYSDDDIWTNQAYRVITFTAPVKREGNEAFYDWFVSNAKEVKAENLYGYKFTKGTEIPVTVPASTLTGRGTQNLEGTVPIFNALFWNSADGADFPDTSLRIKIGCYAHYIVSRQGSSIGSEGKYMRGTSAHIYLENATGKYNVASYNSGSATSTSFVKPTTPKFCTVSSDTNIYFADQPTSSLLTWLNTYATPV